MNRQSLLALCKDCAEYCDCKHLESPTLGVIEADCDVCGKQNVPHPLVLWARDVAIDAMRRLKR